MIESSARGLLRNSVSVPLKLLHISLIINCKNLLLDQDNNFYLISFSIPITCLLDNLWIV